MAAKRKIKPIEHGCDAVWALRALDPKIVSHFWNRTYSGYVSLCGVKVGAFLKDGASVLVDPAVSTRCTKCEKTQKDNERLKLNPTARRFDVVSTAILDNPHHDPMHEESLGNPKKDRVDINFNESPVSRMYGRGQINRLQYVAASRYRAVYERLTGSNDATVKERVDCSSRFNIPESRLQASEEYKSVCRLLGVEKSHLVGMVCGQGLTITHASRKLRKRKDGALIMFKDTLDILCEHWGL